MTLCYSPAPCFEIAAWAAKGLDNRWMDTWSNVGSGEETSEKATYDIKSKIVQRLRHWLCFTLNELLGKAEMYSPGYIYYQGISR